MTDTPITPEVAPTPETPPQDETPVRMVRAHSRRMKDGRIIMINPYPQSTKHGAKGHKNPPPLKTGNPDMDTRRDPVSHRRKKVGRPPNIHTKHKRKPDTVKAGHSDWTWATMRLQRKHNAKPAHLVDPEHAADIRDMLDQPLAFITAMRISAPAGSELLGVLQRSTEALLQARAFINHFTYHPSLE